MRVIFPGFPLQPDFAHGAEPGGKQVFLGQLQPAHMFRRTLLSRKAASQELVTPPGNRRDSIGGIGVAWESGRGTAKMPGSKLGPSPLSGSEKSEKPCWGVHTCKKAEAGRARGPHCKERVASLAGAVGRPPPPRKPGSRHWKALGFLGEKNEVTRAHTEQRCRWRRTDDTAVIIKSW